MRNVHWNHYSALSSTTGSVATSAATTSSTGASAAGVVSAGASGVDSTEGGI